MTFKKTAKEKHINLINKVAGALLFILFNCLSYAYLDHFESWFSNALFLISCILYAAIYYINNIKKNLIISIIYNISFVFINFIFNNLEGYINISSSIWEYVVDIIILLMSYILIINVMTRFIDYKNHTVANKEFGLLMVFGAPGILSIIFYVNILSQIVGIICNIAIIMLSYEFKIVQGKAKQEKLLLERNKLLEEQDKLIKANEAEKYKSYQKSKEAEEKIR